MMKLYYEGMLLNSILSRNVLHTQCRNYSRLKNIVRPAKVTPRLEVPSHIIAPDYFTIKPRRQIDYKTAEDIKLMRESCQLARKILRVSSDFVKVGVTTDEIDRQTHEAIIAHNAYPSPLGYRRYPKSICTSVNNVVCHGIPDTRPLQDGDIITIDITVFYNGYHGDCSETYEVGEVDVKGRQLIEATRRCRDEAIKMCGPGKPFSIIGRTITPLAESLGFKVIPDICGHGIGTYFHGPPDILHFGNGFAGIMQEGMTFTIEPALSESTESVETLDDGWTVITDDNTRAAQFEHTILITSNGAEILTS
ncbi:Methionine aminopeptidase 1D, mitochondrial [Chamberlinius hualienensis]